MINWEALGVYGVKGLPSLANVHFQAWDAKTPAPADRNHNANVCTCTSMQRSLTEHVWHIWSSQRLYEAHPNHSSQPGPILSYDNKNRSVGTEYRIDIGRAETWLEPSCHPRKNKGAAPLYKVKTAVAAFCRLLSVDQGNVTMFTDISKFCGFCHAQHMRNMHAT